MLRLITDFPDHLVLPLKYALSLILLSLGWSLVGWWLTALAAAWPLWVGTLLVSVYLISIGTGAIALANGWVVLLVTLVLYEDRVPPFWRNDLPYKYWAIMLLLLWGVGTGLVFLLGIQSQGLWQWPRPYQRRLRLGLVGLSWLSLSLGSLAYQLGLLG
jgi:hypothetical protein